MKLFDKLFGKKKEEEQTSMLKSQTAYTGQKDEYIGDHLKKYRFYVNGILLGKPMQHLNENSSEYNRQMVLLSEAEEAIRAGDTAKLDTLTKRARHEASLLNNPEFKVLVEEAYAAAKETGLRYTDPEYQAAFSNVMIKAEEMQPNIAQKLSDVVEKMHKNGVKETSPVSAEFPHQKTEIKAEHIAVATKDSYQK